MNRERSPLISSASAPWARALVLTAQLALSSFCGCTTPQDTPKDAGDGVPMDSLHLMCLSGWWTHGTRACAPGTEGSASSDCEGTLLVRTFSPDRTRIDIPVDVTRDGHYRPRFDEAQVEPFRFEFPDGPGLVVATAHERHHVTCRYMGGTPTIDGVLSQPVPLELQSLLFAWRKRRLAANGLDAVGQPLMRP